MRLCLVLCVLFAILFSIACGDKLDTTDCLMETSLTILEFAKDSLLKAKINRDTHKKTATPMCGADKYLSYMTVATHFMADGMLHLEESRALNLNDSLQPGNETNMGTKSPMDCEDILANGETATGTYKIYPRSRVASRELQVLCDMETDGGGWTLIQRRGSYDHQQDFQLNWAEYKKGFGDLAGEFWIGNDNIYGLSNQAEYKIRFDLTDNKQEKAYAVYDTFYIDEEAAKYMLHIENYSGTAGDAMSKSNNQPFTTLEALTNVDGMMNSTSNASANTVNEKCSNSFRGGFWFGECGDANPNGLHRPGKKKDRKAMFWKTWKEFEGLSATEIKIKRAVPK